MRLTLPLLLLVALVLGGCFPKPDEPIDYLELDEAIIVQMDVSGGGFSQPSSLPEFTLYGDGTLLLLDEQGAIVQANLSKTSIEDLLEYIDGAGFFNFLYEQPSVFVTDSPTTYLYVSTREAANAVAAYALGFETPDTPDYDQVRKLVEIRDRLNEVAGAAETGPWEPEAGELRIERLPEGTDAEELWPFPGIDLDGIATERLVTYPLDPNLLELLSISDKAREARLCPVAYAEATFCVTYRPVLPYEENFPEFEPPG